MAQTTEIAWCDSTFNPWIGCTKVSPGCAHCYAERDFDLRKHVARWGAGQPRHRTSEAYWKQPLKWDRDQAELVRCANLAGEHPPRRPRVFCASLADWLDDEVPIEWLAALLDLVHDCTNLDFLLLTKRPENWRERIRLARNYLTMRSAHTALWLANWLPKKESAGMPARDGTPPANVWIGTTIENQKAWDDRATHLFSIPARVRFLSCEPLLEGVDFGLLGTVPKDITGGAYRMTHEMIHWVICGGESGPHARPMHPDWARSLRDQCAAAGVPFLFKQWGEWTDTADCGKPGWSTPDAYLNFEGQVVDETTARKGGTWKGIWRFGKHAAGRRIDGREHNEFPSVSVSS